MNRLAIPACNVEHTMTSPDPMDDDDAELELEPVDPEILALERARAQRQVERLVEKVDVDEIYQDTSPYSDLEFNLPGITRFRFTTQHLLILTALVAIGLTLLQLLGGWLAGFLVAVLSVAAGWFWVFRQEARIDAERARRREEFFAHDASGAATTAESEPAADRETDAAAEPFRRFDFKFAFSMQELFVTMTVAAVAVALLRWQGPDQLASVLGLVAVAGLLVYAVGFDPPRLAVLGWALLLVVYVMVSLIAMLAADDAAAAAAAIPVTLVGS